MAQWVFNRNGKAKIIFEESCFRDARGRVVGWINNTNVFSLRGRHIGWYEHGVVYDRNNNTLGFIKNCTGYIPSFPGLSGTPGMPGFSGKPGRPGFSGIPGKPGRGGWSKYDLEFYFKENQ
ncbi:MAG: collagen-like triple helix repeat-containing protein [Candidatus Helarchaeota archaeon]